MRLLLDKGANLSAVDSAGATPLHFASVQGHAAVVRLLIDKGAEVSCKKNDGGTPLHLAAINGFETVSSGLALSQKGSTEKPFSAS